MYYIATLVSQHFKIASLLSFPQKESRYSSLMRRLRRKLHQTRTLHFSTIFLSPAFPFVVRGKRHTFFSDRELYTKRISIRRENRNEQWHFIKFLSLCSYNSMKMLLSFLVSNETVFLSNVSFSAQNIYRISKTIIII